MNLILPLLINLVVIVITLAIAAGLDLRNRTVPVSLWVIPVLISTPTLAWLIFVRSAPIFMKYFLLSLIVMGLFYLLGKVSYTDHQLIGGADALAGMLVAFALPISPWGDSLYLAKVVIVSFALALLIAGGMAITKRKINLPFLVPLSIGVCVALIWI